MGVKGCTPWGASPSGGEGGSPSYVPKKTDPYRENHDLFGVHFFKNNPGKIHYIVLSRAKADTRNPLLYMTLVSLTRWATAW
jgi:hypothetical protein